jgi:hypothetical protein
MKGEGRDVAYLASAHPLPNPSPVKGEGCLSLPATVPGRKPVVKATLVSLPLQGERAGGGASLLAPSTHRRCKQLK